jgi:hypothetical protein
MKPMGRDANQLVIAGRLAAFVALGLLGLSSLGCKGEIDGASQGGPGATLAGSSGQAGGSASGGSGSGSGGASGGMGGVDLSEGGPKLRVLTQSEYKNALTYLLGPIGAPLELPADLSTGGFTAIGSAEVAINRPAVALYETAARTAAAEVFGDAARWQALVGCQPQVDLSDACVVTFLQTFGRRAFRRDLTDVELQQWLGVGQETAQLSASAEQGLAAIVSGLLQSPNFLYRIETNRLDVAIGRLKYDGPSMATRLSFLLTGRPPSDALLNAAASGQLDTAEGVRAAAAPLLDDPIAIERMSEFFAEFSQAELVLVVEKSEEMFSSWNAELQSSMLQATQLFIKNVVLAPGADVRSFFDSNQTFVDASLAPIYDVAAPAAGFEQITLSPETGRAGILGQAAVLAGHSLSDHNSPTRRGLFVTGTFLCQQPLAPPDGVITELPIDPTLTTRQRLELHRSNPSCASCHALFDPPGMALEHFDSIGKYRATEDGLQIDATGMLDGVAFDGAVQLGAALRDNARAQSCLMSNFYRSANAVVDAKPDAAQVEALKQTLAEKGYVWRDLLAEFVASDAFRSAPATIAGDQ